MDLVQAFEDYQKEHGLYNQHRGIFVYLDEIGASPKTVSADDLSRYFLMNPLSKKTRANVRWIVKQVLSSKGVDCGWITDVKEPPPSYYLTLSEILSVIDSYANSCEGIEPSGFDTVKACVVLTWTGLDAGQMSALKLSDMRDGRIYCKDRVFDVKEDLARELLENYAKSEGYIFYQKEKNTRKGNSRFLPFVEKDYFLRSVRPLKNRERYPYTLFLRIKDLGIRMNGVRKAGEFSRLYDLEKSGVALTFTGTKAAEYKEYRSQREEAES